MSCKIYIRCGDQDDYHEFDSIQEVAEHLEPLEALPPYTYCQYGLTCDGYTGNNYISAYWGSDVETPIRGLDPNDIRALTRCMRSR